MGDHPVMDGWMGSLVVEGAGGEREGKAIYIMHKRTHGMWVRLEGLIKDKV